MFVFPLSFFFFSPPFQFLLDNEDKTYIDVNDIADFLQKRYRDYRTKKRSAFRALVRKAYTEIADDLAKKSEFSHGSLWHEDEEDDDDEVDLEVRIFFYLEIVFKVFLNLYLMIFSFCSSL